MPALEIRRDRTPVMLRKLAKAEEDVRVARRLLAIATALDGKDRKAAAESAGMDRQTLRDWVIRYNEHGIDGLLDRGAAAARRGWGPMSWPSFTPSCWRVPTRRRMGSALSRVRTWCGSASSGSARPCIVRRWVVCCAAWDCRDKRRVPATRGRTRPRRRPLKRAPQLLRKLQRTHKDKRLRLFFQDESRIGQKGRVCRVWWKRGERPPGLCDKRFTFAYIFAAVEPGTDNAFALVLPYANTEAMQEFLDRFAATIGEDEHVALILNQAGWHVAGALRVPASITLVPLPPYSPELNPVEWVWEYMKERFLSLRLHNDYDAIADAACKAWNRLRAETGRITSLCSHPWIMEVKP